MIRPLQPEDIPALTDIYNYYIVNTYVSFEEEAISLETMQARVNKIILASYPWLVVEEDGLVIGYAYASQWKDRSAYRHTAEVTIYLSHLHTGKGWGEKLYRALFKALKAMSIHTVIGNIALPNDASVALHEKVGMVKVAHFKEIGFKFDQWIDTAFWQRELSADNE